MNPLGKVILEGTRQGHCTIPWFTAPSCRLVQNKEKGHTCSENESIFIQDFYETNNLVVGVGTGSSPIGETYLKHKSKRGLAVKPSVPALYCTTELFHLVGHLVSEPRSAAYYSFHGSQSYIYVQLDLTSLAQNSAFNLYLQ